MFDAAGDGKGSEGGGDGYRAGDMEEGEGGKEAAKKGTRLLVLPGLEKLGDGKGEMYEVPKVVVEGESVVV